MRSVVWTMLLTGCIQVVGNQPPTLTKVNGKRHVRGERWFLLDVAGESEVRLELEVHDPEGHDVLVWFPRAPAGLDFAPEDHAGTWHLDEVQIGVEELWVVLEDDAADPSSSDWMIRVEGVKGQPGDSGI